MVEQEELDGIALVRLAHGKVNALDLELVDAIIETCGELARSSHRAVVLTGAGPAFSAGVDLRRFTTAGDDYLTTFLAVLDTVFEALFTLPQPVVAAVNGHAIAGGCVLACACDRRIMANASGQIGVPELLVGVPFPTAALEVMRHTVGTPRLRDLVVSGVTLSAAMAQDAGLVDEVVNPDDVVDRALAVADELSGGRIPADTYRITKRQLRRPTVERIQRHRSLDEAEVIARWTDPATAASIDNYMARVTGR